MIHYCSSIKHTDLISIQKRDLDRRTYLNAVLIKKTRHGETSLLIQGLTKNKYLLKKEDSSLLHPAQQASIRV